MERLTSRYGQGRINGLSFPGRELLDLTMECDCNFSCCHVAALSSGLKGQGIHVPGGSPHTHLSGCINISAPLPQSEQGRGAYFVLLQGFTRRMSLISQRQLLSSKLSLEIFPSQSQLSLRP